MTVLDDARRALTHSGVYVMNQVDLSRCLRVVGDEWETLADHWDDLAPDRDAADLGITRFKRFGLFDLTGPSPARALPHPKDGRQRSVEPLTDAFAGEPLLGRLLPMLGWLADGLDTPERWLIKVHLFRVLAAGDGEGRPTPEGMHRDDVTLFASMLIRRINAVGGESTVVDTDGRPVVTATLVEPGTLVLSDDRRTLHGVSPIRAAVAGKPAVRDVLVITLAPG